MRLNWQIVKPVSFTKKKYFLKLFFKGFFTHRLFLKNIYYSYDKHNEKSLVYESIDLENKRSIHLIVQCLTVHFPRIHLDRSP